MRIKAKWARDTGSYIIGMRSMTPGAWLLKDGTFLLMLNGQSLLNFLEERLARL